MNTRIVLEARKHHLTSGRLRRAGREITGMKQRIGVSTYMDERKMDRNDERYRDYKDKGRWISRQQLLFPDTPTGTDSSKEEV